MERPKKFLEDTGRVPAHRFPMQDNKCGASRWCGGGGASIERIHPRGREDIELCLIDCKGATEYSKGETFCHEAVLKIHSCRVGEKVWECVEFSLFLGTVPGCR